MKSSQTIVIAGAGLAGYTLAKELRKLSADLPVTLVTADEGHFYSKPMLSNALAQGLTAQTLVQGTREEQEQKLGIRILSRRQVQAVDRAAHVLHTDAGAVEYGSLALAVGAEPVRLPFPGDAAGAVLRVNDLEDYGRFRAALVPGARVVVIGAGLVGCEFANDLAASGYSVSMVEAGAMPLARLIPRPLSARFRTTLAEAGVEWHCGTSVTCVEHGEACVVVELDSGARLQADVVLAATGLQARTGLAGEAGLEIRRGIVVDECLRTVDPDIYALGDCAETRGMVLPFVSPLMQSARALAATLTGNTTRLLLPALPVVVKTPCCPLVVCPPPADCAGEWRCERDDDAGSRFLFINETGAPRGFALAGGECGQRRQLAQRLPPLAA